MAKELNIHDTLVQQDLEDFCRRTTDKILANFEELGIGKFNPLNSKAWLRGGKFRSDGSLYRSIYWTIFNEAGGDSAKIEFYMMNYGAFVETGTGMGVKYSPLPAISRMEAIKRKGTKRLAKPFFRSEIRLHAKITLDVLAKHFSYSGGFYIVNALKSTQKEVKAAMGENKWNELKKMFE